MKYMFCELIIVEAVGGAQYTAEDMEIRSWDTNAITPGTPFMERLALSIYSWIQHKMCSDQMWRQVGSLAYLKLVLHLGNDCIVVTAYCHLFRCECSRRRRA